MGGGGGGGGEVGGGQVGRRAARPPAGPGQGGEDARLGLGGGGWFKFYLLKFPHPPPPRPPLSPFQDFRLYRIPHPGLSSFVGTGLICLSARLVRLALVPPTAVNVTGISRARGIDARRVGARAMPNRTCGLYGNIPKMNTKKQRHSVRKRGKTLSQVPSRSFFP